MRIGLVLPTASGYSETFFYNKIKGLESNGHKVILFVNNDKNISLNEAIPIKVAPKLTGPIISVIWESFCSLAYVMLFHFKTSRRLFRLNKEDGFSRLNNLKNIVINSHLISESLDWLHFGYGTMALGRENVAAAIGAKMAISFRGFDIGIYPIKHPGCYEMIWNKADKIHVISDDIADLVYQQGFKDQVPLVKITPAIDVSYFQNDKAYTPTDKTHFVTVARLHWKKGLDYTLEALSLLKKSGYSFRYTIIGDGDDYEYLKFTVHQLNLEDDVIFTGRIDHNEVKTQLSQGHIYLQYSVQEGFCNAVLEAQAMGLLCVVSDAEGLSENVLDKITGFVVKKRNPKLLMSQLVKVLKMNEVVKEKIKKNAIDRIKKEFQLFDQIKKFKVFYEED